jgi:hypothetical protein
MIDEKKLVELREATERFMNASPKTTVPLQPGIVIDLFDTLESLWKENAELRRVLNAGGCQIVDEMEALRKENAELRQDVAEKDGVIQGALKTLRSVMDNNEKLQETLDLLNHDFCENLKGLKAVARAAPELLSGHDNLYRAQFGSNSNPLDDIAAKPMRVALAALGGGKEKA